MNLKFILVLLLSLMVLLMLSSCKKDPPLPPPQNYRPAVNAGTDITIILPADSAELRGSGAGIDGNVIGFEWFKISGPSSCTIVNPNARITKLKDLVEGVYEFKLIVDDGLRLGSDTVAVFVVHKTTIQAINCQMTSLGRLSQGVPGVAVSAGNKILFAGGSNSEKVSSRVDIYDINMQSWSVAELSEARTLIGAATVGNKALFAGGATSFDYSLFWEGWPISTSRADIYDVSTNTWTTTELPEARNFYNCEQNGAVIENKVFFAGRLGLFVTSDVQVYDVSVNSWSSYALSEPRAYHAMVSVRDKLLIAGGLSFWGSSKTVEVYDASANLLSIDSLSEAGGGYKAASLNNKAFFTWGGFVDIYDGTTQTWSVASLSGATTVAAAVSAGQRIFFFGDKRVDIYDDPTGTWSIADLPVSFSENSTIIAAGGNIYATNGEQVWLVEF